MLLAFCKAAVLTSGSTGEKGKGNTHRPMSLSNAEVSVLPSTVQSWLQQLSTKEKQHSNTGCNHCSTSSTDLAQKQTRNPNTAEHH